MVENIEGLRAELDVLRLGHAKILEYPKVLIKKFVIQALEGSEPTKEIEAPAGSEYVGWTPDGEALMYTLIEGNARNLWMRH